MALWDSLSELFRSDAQHLDRPTIPVDHITPPPPDASSIAAGQGYFQIWLVQMFLKNDRDWFKGWYPVVQSLTTFRFGNPPDQVEIAQIAGPGYLRNVDASHLDRAVQVDCPLTPLVPFSGGTVRLEAGLVAMQANEVLKRFLDVMGGFASLVAVPQLSSALNITGMLSKGAEQLLGIGQNQMLLGYQRTYEGSGGGGDNDLRPGYIVVINSPTGSYPADRLWIKDSKLLEGPDLDRAHELTGADYMVLRIETRAQRDDWDSLVDISKPFSRATEALTELTAQGDFNVADADMFIRIAVGAALNSPDLATVDRRRVARAIRQRYDEYKSDLESRGDLEQPTRPTFSEVGQLAQTLDDSPATAAELFGV